MAKRDFDRGLNDRGRRGAAIIGQLIAQQGLNIDLLLASPAMRVKQTLMTSMPHSEPVFDRRLYLASCDTLMDLLRENGGQADTVLIAAHNPGLQELLFALVPPAAENTLLDDAANKYPTATFALLTLNIDHWADLEEGCGQLVQFTRPRDLDPQLGPDLGPDLGPK